MVRVMGTTDGGISAVGLLRLQAGSLDGRLSGRGSAACGLPGAGALLRGRRLLLV